MLEKFQKNILSLALLCLLLTGLMGRSISVHLPVQLKVTSSEKQKEVPVAKIEIGTTAIALVPILNLEFPEWYSPVFFVSKSIEVLLDFYGNTVITLQEKFLKILFQNIMAANAP